MLKSLKKKLDEVIEQYNDIQKKLMDSSLNSKDRISLSKKFATIEQILQKKNSIEKVEIKMMVAAVCTMIQS